jgi:Anti-sigma factor NepR
MSMNDKDEPKVTQPDSRHDTDESSRGGLDDRLQAHIGVQLKLMYDGFLNDPIPDRFVELLEKLDEVSKAAEPSKEGREESGE